MIINATATHIPLKNESVQCVVTSPPYFGLRRYKIPDSIWDGVNGCEHKWGKFQPNPMKPYQNQVAQTKYTNASSADGQNANAGRFCSLCGVWKGQLGGEPLISLYVSHIVQVFREVRRVLRRDGVLWLNMGDSYASGQGGCRNPGGGSQSFGKHLKKEAVHYLQRTNISDLRRDGLKPKDLCEVPSEVVRALRDDGWWLRSRIPWVKLNSMPSSCTDRPTVAVEYVFLLTKSKRYFYDTEAVRMPAGRAKPHGKNSRMNVDRDPAHLPPYRSNTRKDLHGPTYSRHRSSIPGGQDLRVDVVPGRYRRDSDWFFESLKGLLADGEGGPLAFIVNPQPYKGAHYSVFPEDLVEPMIKAGSSERGCCRKCGAPWERVVEKSGGRDWKNDRMKEKGIPGGLSGDWAYKRGQSMNPLNDTKEVRTVGWQPTCSCDAGDPVPCLVLDPFLGSGTVGAVAERLNRRWVGLDLGYHELQQKRLVGIQKEMPLIG